MIKTLSFLFLLALTLSLRSSGRVPNTNLELGWEFDKDYIQVEIISKSLNFVPLLMGSSMTKSDLWVCSKEDDEKSWSVKDRWSMAHGMPQDDVALGGVDDVEDGKVNATEGGVVCSFRRKLMTHDEFDLPLERGKSIKICSYSANTTKFSKHISKDVRYCFYWPLIDGYQGDLSSELESSPFTLAHGIVLTVCWGFLMDVAIMIVRFLRTAKGYKLLHASFFFLINLASLPFIIIMIVKQKVNIFHNFEFMEPLTKVHLILGFSILVLIVTEHTIGIMTKSTQENAWTKPKKFEVIRLVHQLVGYTLFILTKTQILIGWWVYGTSVAIILSMLLLWFVALIAVRAFLEDRFLKGKLGKLVHFFDKNKRTESGNQSQLLLDDNQDEEAAEILSAIQAKKTKEYIRHNFSDSYYFYFKDQVIYLKNFDHPGGAALLKQAIGLDITKYIYGGMPLEGSKTKLHKHSVYARAFLQSKAIGTHINSTVKLGDSKLWQIKSLEELTPSLFKFNFFNETFQIKTNPRDYLNYIGHYVLVTTAGASRTYTLVMSELDTNIKHRNALLVFYAKGFTDEKLEVSKEEFTSYLPLVIKRYPDGTVSDQVHYSKKLESISGVYGLPLDIRPGVNLIVTGGTGIFPFLDLFDLLLKKAIFTLYDRSGRTREHEFNLYGVDYKNVYPESKFVVYASFRSLSEFTHFSWLNALHEISAQNNLNLFELHIKDFSFKSLGTFKGRVDFQFFQKKFRGGSFSKLFVCGPPAMNESILEILQEAEYDSGTYTIM